MGQCLVHQVEWSGPQKVCPVCMLVDERQVQIDRALAAETKLEWLQEWREDLVTALAIMDERGRGIDGGKSRVLWQSEWDQLRHLILVVSDSIQEQRL